jgi:hypothetical protein
VLASLHGGKKENSSCMDTDIGGPDPPFNFLWLA